MTWQTKKLGEVCDIIGGGTPSKSTATARFYDGDILWATVRDMKSEIISDTEFKISQEAVKKSATNIIPKNNVVIASRVGLGKVCFLENDTAINQDLRGVIPKKKDQLSVNFLFWWFKDISDDIVKAGKGATVHGVTLPFLKNLEIPLPPLPEQRRIVKILDEVFDGTGKVKENAERNLKNSRLLFESYLSEVFLNPNGDWEERKLSEVCEINSKLIDPRKSDFIELLHVGGANIESKSGKLVDLKTAKEEKLISGKFLFDDTIVLYSKIRPYLMKVVRPDFKGLCSADIYPLSPLPKILTRDYLFYLLLTSDFTNYAIKGSGRAGMPKVNREHLFEYSCFIPPLPEQKAIVAKLDALSAETKKLEGMYRQKIADADELKKSVLKKAFSGEL